MPFLSDTSSHYVFVSREILASFFSSDHPSVDPFRRAVEASWAFTCLKDGTALALFLASARTLSHFWWDAGDVGRLEVIKLWKVAEDLRGGPGQGDVSCDARAAHGETGSALAEAETSLATKYLCILGAELGGTLLVAKCPECSDSGLQRLNFQSFKILRALFQLLKDLRVEAAAHLFLVQIQANIEKALLAYSPENADPCVGCIRVAFAWVHACIGDALKDLGDYSTAISMWRRSIQEFAGIAGLSPSHTICELHRCVGVVHDLEKRHEEALAEFELARSGCAALAELHATKVSSSIETESALNPSRSDAFQSLIADFNDSQNFSCNSSRLQIFAADIDKEVANVLFSLHRFEEALTCYRNVHATLKRVLGEAHPVTARAIWGIGLSALVISSNFPSLLRRALHRYFVTFLIFYCSFSSDLVLLFLVSPFRCKRDTSNRAVLIQVSLRKNLA
jgi:hypothetical protein